MFLEMVVVQILTKDQKLKFEVFLKCLFCNLLRLETFLSLIICMGKVEKVTNTVTLLQF